MPSMPTTSDSFGDLHSVSDGSEGVTKRQLVDKQLPKLDVAGSNPVARSWKYNGLNGLMHTGPRGDLSARCLFRTDRSGFSAGFDAPPAFALTPG